VPIFRISPTERWRQIRSNRRIARNERMAVSAGASHHVIDAAAGVVIYRGGAYSAEFYGQAFVGDGQNNLIHRRRIVPDGVTFRSERVDSETDFIRSSDIWFRPVNLINAPDGTLYCCDMSREVLESIHIPLDVVKHLDLRSGRRNGRIYRIAPPAFQSPPPPRLSQASTADLVAALESPHGWYRDTAHRLLYERQDKSAVPELRRLVRESSRPQTRLLAAWQLRGMASLDDDTCLQLLSDAHADVRENGVRLAEARLDQSQSLLDRVCALADDEAVRVRFQTAFSLGTVANPQTIAALRRLAVRDGDDIWMRTALLSSVASSAVELLAELISMQEIPASATAVIRQLVAIVGARNQPDEVVGVLDAVAASSVGSNDELRQSLLLELGSAMRRSGGRFPPVDASRNGGRMLQEALLRATRIAQDPAFAEVARVSAIRLLSCQNAPERRAVLVELLSATQPVSVQVAAVEALADDSDPMAATILLQHWRTFVPETRASAMTGLLLHSGSTQLLLEAAVRGDISVSDLEPTRWSLLLKHTNPAVREMAEQLFGRASEQPRQAVVAEYRKALSLSGDPQAGKRVFEKTCAACHQLGGIGISIGPNLASSPSRDPSALLNNILDPNQFVLPSFQQYTVVDGSGRTYSGLLASQSATSVTLRKEKAETVTILRGDIEELVCSGKSLMPEGLEKELSHQSVADLIAWIAGASAQTPENPNAERDFGTLPGLIE
jgi:putative heme-binding domain-containing protein